MALGGAIGDALGHRVGFTPYDLAAQIPAIRLQRQCQASGDHAQVFRLQAGRWPIAELAISMGIGGLLWHKSIVGTRRSVCLAACVRITYVYEAYAIVSQHAPHLPEHADHAGYVLVGRGLQAEL